MFDQFKHTMECKKCQGKQQFDKFPTVTKCKCGGELDYIGFQSYIDPILQEMLNEAKTANHNEEQPKVDQPKVKHIEETKVEETKIEETKEVKEVEEIKGESKEVVQEATKALNEIKTEIENKESEDIANVAAEVIEEVIYDIETQQPTTTLEIEDIFDPNEKMTNAKMEPLLKEFIPKEEVEKILLLKEHYASTFEKAIKYIGKKNQTKFEELLADFK